MEEPTRILVVDDQFRARKSMLALLSAWSRTAAVQEAADGREAVQIVQDWQPDAVLMDVRMPGMNGLEATRLIKKSRPRVKVIALSMYAECEIQALAAGADAFVGKEEALDRVLEVLADLIQVGE